MTVKSLKKTTTTVVHTLTIDIMHTLKLYNTLPLCVCVLHVFLMMMSVPHVRQEEIKCPSLRAADFDMINPARACA